jgi:alkylation response protein AidB-like acyl-CoA dehydrogenase
MTSQDFFADNDDLAWHFDVGIDWATLHEQVALLEEGDAPQFQSTDEAKEFWRDIASLVGTFAAQEIAPRAEAIDREEIELRDGEVHFPPALTEIFKQIRALELHGMCLPQSLGGMNCPLLLYMLTGELIARADVSVMTHHSFHGGMAMAMLTYSLDEGTTELDLENRRLVSTRFDKEIREIAAGDAWGCMDITEPNAGSDMAALVTKGEQDDDGSWFVTGQKIFVTSGHGKYHFVIARTEPIDEAGGPSAGLNAMSLFLVETYTEDTDGNRIAIATLERLEEKLGHHGSPTVAVSFDRAPARLIGKRGEGFRGMLLLMNNARIAVGFESLGIAEAAYRLAKDYASQRPSMGKTIDKHEIIADYLDEMDVDIRGLRALSVKAAFESEHAHRARLRRDHDPRLSDAQKAELDRLIEEKTWSSRLTTPLIKFLGAEKAVEISRRAVQIHGGCGYTREYGAEKLLRDALVLPIYEGTSQIQALMATKDTLLAITRSPGAFFSAWAEDKRVAALPGDPLVRGIARLRTYSRAAQLDLMRRILKGKLKGRSLGAWKAALSDWDPKIDFSPALLHAERLARLLADAAIADALHEQVQKDAGRAWILERHLERAEPRGRYLLDCIRTTGNRLLDELADDGPGPDAEELPSAAPTAQAAA